jgi:ferredoxin
MTTSTLARMAQALDGARLIVEEEFCVNSRARHAFCTRCVKACQSEAIKVSEDGVELDEAVCTACGACVPACPAGALRLSGFQPERFVARLNGAAEVHLSCAACERQNEGATIPCHLMLDRRLTAAAFAEGTHHFVLHGVDRCAACHRGDARDFLARLGRTMAKWFDGRGPEISFAAPGDARYSPSGRVGEAGTNRRGFLRLMGLQAGAGVADLLATEVDDADDEPLDVGCSFVGGDALPKHTVPYRVVLARRTERLPWAEDRALPWHTRTIGEACNACMVCAKSCPTGALEDNSDRGARRISFDPAFCTNCTLCQQICPQDMIRPRLAQSVAEATAPRAVLMHRTTRQCDVCRNAFVPSDPASRLCPVCTNEREMDEEWLEMLGD